MTSWIEQKDGALIRRMLAHGGQRCTERQRARGLNQILPDGSVIPEPVHNLRSFPFAGCAEVLREVPPTRRPSERFVDQIFQMSAGRVFHHTVESLDPVQRCGDIRAAPRRNF